MSDTVIIDGREIDYDEFWLRCPMRLVLKYSEIFPATVQQSPGPLYNGIEDAELRR